MKQAGGKLPPAFLDRMISDEKNTDIEEFRHSDLPQLCPSLREAALRLRSVTTPTTTLSDHANDYAQ